MTRPPPISTLFPYPTLSRSPAAMDRLTSAVGDARAPPPAAGYYTVTVTVADGDQTSSWDVYYVPSSRLVRAIGQSGRRSEEHTSELQSQSNLVCRLLLDTKKAGGNGGATYPPRRTRPPQSPMSSTARVPSSLLIFQFMKAGE